MFQTGGFGVLQAGHIYETWWWTFFLLSGPPVLAGVCRKMAHFWPKRAKHGRLTPDSTKASGKALMGHTTSTCMGIHALGSFSSLALPKMAFFFTKKGQTWQACSWLNQTKWKRFNGPYDIYIDRKTCVGEKGRKLCKKQSCHFWSKWTILPPPYDERSNLRVKNCLKPLVQRVNCHLNLWSSQLEHKLCPELSCHYWPFFGPKKGPFFSPKMPINGRTVPGIVYNLNRRIRGLTDSSHTGLKVSNNFFTLLSLTSWKGKGMGSWLKYGPLMTKNCRTDVGIVYVFNRRIWGLTTVHIQE